MSINFFTYLIQIFNFLVLMIILNKLLLKPLMKNLEERRNSIKDKNQELETKLLEVEKEKELFSQKTKDFENFIVDEKTKLSLELENIKKNKFEKIDLECKTKEDLMIKSIEEMKHDAINKISKIICLNVGDLLNNILFSISNIKLQEQITVKFCEQIKALSAEQMALLKNNLKEYKAIKLISSFALAKNEKELIEDLFKNFDIDFDKFEVIEDKDLVLGIKLEIGSLVITSDTQDIIDKFNIKLKEIF